MLSHGLAFKRMRADALVGGEQRPAIAANVWQPDRVCCTRGEEVEVANEGDACVRKGRDQVRISAVVLVKKNDERN